MRIVPTYVAGALLAAFGLVFCIGAFGLGFWTDDGPGPGLLPFAAGAILLPLIAIAMREPIPDDETSFRIEPLGAIILMLLFAAALPWAGFAPTTFVALALWIRIFHRQSWWRAALCAAALTLFGYVIFHVLLKIPMQMFPER